MMKSTKNLWRVWKIEVRTAQQGGPDIRFYPAAAAIWTSTPHPARGSSLEQHVTN